MGSVRDTLSLLAVALVLVAHVAIASASPCIQANFGDASFAGGMSYDAQLDVIYVTGQVGPSSCFVGVLKQTKQSTDIEESLNAMEFVSKQVFNEQAICQTLTLRNDQTGTPLLLTVMDEGGILTDTRPSGSQKAVQYGGMIELQFDADGSKSQFSVDRSVLLHQDIVQIPRSIVTDPNSVNRVFVATMTSESGNLHEGMEGDGSISNLTPGGDLKYGNNYAMTIESLRLANPLGDTSEHASVEATSLWKKPFGVFGDTSGLGAVVNQILFHGDDEIIAVGSTRGSGFAYGEGLDDTLAGFIAKFNPDHGQLQGSRRFHVEVESNNMPTYIESICQDDSEPDSLYVVGSYEDIEGSKKIPFVTKLSSSSLDSVWEQRLPATTSAFAVGCGVSSNEDGHNGSVLYVAGVVEASGELMGQTTSHLQDDVFVVQLSALDGTTFWMKQIGTSENDRLAHGGSGLLVLDNGGILLMGDTTGNLYSSSSQSSEIFVVYMDSQGNTPDSSEVSGIDYSKERDSIGISIPSKLSHHGDDNDTTEDNPVGGGSAVDSTNPTAAPDSGQGFVDSPSPGPSDLPSVDSNETNQLIPNPPSQSVERLYFMMAIVIVIMMGCCCYICFQHREKEKVTERALVFSYLQAFDVEDIDVRHSATGGWHGTYVGKLAQGDVDANADIDNLEFAEDLDFRVGRRESRGDDDSSDATGTLLSGYSHSSIVKDSLFVDYDTKPTYGGGSRLSSNDFSISDGEDDNDAGNERSSFVRDPRRYSDRLDEVTDRRDSDFSLARLSRKGPGDNQNALDPWGKEII